MKNIDGFDHIVSLGYNCEVSFRIAEYSKKAIDSYPLSWAYMLDQRELIHVLDHLDGLSEERKLTFQPQSGMFLVDDLNISVHSKLKYSLNDEKESESFELFMKTASEEVRERNSYLLRKWHNLLSGNDSILFLLKLQEWRSKEDCADIIIKTDGWLNKNIKSGRYLLACFTSKPDYFKFFCNNISLSAVERLRVSLISEFAPDSDTEKGGDTNSWCEAIDRWNHCMDWCFSSKVQDHKERITLLEKENAELREILEKEKKRSWFKKLIYSDKD